MFQNIDTRLDAWARKRRIALFKEFAGREERFFYFTDRNGTTRQFVIRPHKDIWKVIIYVVESDSLNMDGKETEELFGEENMEDRLDYVMSINSMDTS